MERFDVAVIGAGAAGLYCAGIAGQRGLRVVVLDHAARIGEKIRISGGGRCNFTNVEGGDWRRYRSADPRFARAALRAHPPAHFIERVRAHRIGFHEKHRGQLFCDDSSQRIIAMLRDECAVGRVVLRHPVRVTDIATGASPRFVLSTDAGPFGAERLVVATGGLSIPAIGASDQAWRLAARWGLSTVAPRPGLVPLVFTAAAWQPFTDLAGVALPVGIVAAGADGRRGTPFQEDLLFTHRGLSGPAILQASSDWMPGDRLVIDLAPGVDLAARLLAAKSGASGADAPRQQLVTVLGGLLPRRLAQAWLARASSDAQAVVPAVVQAGPSPAGMDGRDRLATVADSRLRQLGQALRHWTVTPAGTEGWRKAEVTQGGVATTELDPVSLEARRMPGSYWIGEAVDVTGWLGGYNFQWAWSSGWSAAMAMAR